MKLKELFSLSTPTLSFEVFPPKAQDSFEKVKGAIGEIADLKPDYMSVTYGAGGGTSDFTVNIAEDIEKNHGVTALAHLTCVSSDKERILSQIAQLKNAGIENILALRGDIPKGMESSGFGALKYASELIYEIKKQGDFCIGGACYPEGHVESESIDEDFILIY